MELRQIRYFVAVAEERSFSRAAERLRIAQSAVSQQIKSLERSLGATLFDRTARPIELTEAGVAFLAHGRRMLELADRAVEDVTAIDRNPRHSLRIGTSAFANPPIVDRVIEAARDRLPDVDLQIEMDTTVHNIRALVRRSLDAVFAYLPFDADEEPHYLPLGFAEVVLAVPETHPFAALERIPRAGLIEETLLISPRRANQPVADHVFGSLFGRLDHPNAVEIADVGPDRLLHVAQGRGLSLVAVPLERLHPISGVAYRRVEDPVPTIEYGLLWFDEPHDGLSSFLDLARELAETEELPSLTLSSVGE